MRYVFFRIHDCLNFIFIACHFSVFFFDITTGSRRVGECRHVSVIDTLNEVGRGTWHATVITTQPTRVGGKH